jgi:cytochrome c
MRAKHAVQYRSIFVIMETFMPKVVFAALTLTASLVASAGPGWAQDVEAGEKSFRKCTPCHDIGPDAQNKLGPKLNGLDGRKSGSVEGYNYSEANKASGITWNEAEFKEYITDPKVKVPKTKMIFAGIKNERERNDLWAYLKQFGADGKTKN